MTNAYVVEQNVLEGTDNWNVGAVAVAVAGQTDETLITTSDIDGSITFAIYEQGNGTALYSTTLSKTDVWLNTPRVDAFWKNMDTVGYNFIHRVALSTIGATLLKGGRRYHMVYSVPTSANGTLRLVHIWNVQPLHT